MPTPTKGARLGGSSAHERIILANLARQLFEHDRIVPPAAKAKRLRPLAEKLITKAKRGDIHARRLVLTTVRDKGVVHKLFTEIAPTFAEREGGYTRITKVGPRKGDNAPMAMIELVTVSAAAGDQASTSSASSARRASGRQGASAVPATQPASAAAPAAATPPTSVTPAATTPAGEPAGEQAPDDTPQFDANPAGQPSETDRLVGEAAEDQATSSEEATSDTIEAEEGAAQVTPPTTPGAGSTGDRGVAG